MDKSSHRMTSPHPAHAWLRDLRDAFARVLGELVPSGAADRPAGDASSPSDSDAREAACVGTLQRFSTDLDDVLGRATADLGGTVTLQDFLAKVALFCAPKAYPDFAPGVGDDEAAAGRAMQATAGSLLLLVHLWRNVHRA